MTRVQRRSKSQYHNHMKRKGYKWYSNLWCRILITPPVLIPPAEGEEGEDRLVTIKLVLDARLLRPPRSRAAVVS